MKANVSPALSAHDFAGLATAFAKIAAMAPPEYANWSSIARDGEAAAKTGDIDAVKASCSKCHNRYRGKYKVEMRARPL
jgi:hypothetical protein